VLGIINVFARDVAEVTGILMQIWFWLTPIVYSVDAVPARFRWFVSLNPMAPLVVAYQDAMLSGRWPDLAALWPTAAVTLVLVAFAFLLFRRASAELVDAL
jgi:lipopolysaccharide transport system permease protein